MTTEATRLAVSLEQMTHMIEAFRDLQQTVLPRDPTLFRVLAEGPLDMISSMLREIDAYVAYLELIELRTLLQEMQSAWKDLEAAREAVPPKIPLGFGTRFDGPLIVLDRNRRETLARVKELTKETAVS